MMNSETNRLQWLDRIVMAGLILYSAMFLYHGVRLVLYPYDVDNSEAYLLYQGERIANGQFLYRSIDEAPFLVDNYPPVYSLVLALGNVLFGNVFFWGRLVSLVSTVCIAGLLGAWIWDLTRYKAASIYGGLIFLSFYHVYDWCALARVDSLGVLLSVLGLYGAQRRWHWGVITLILVTALYTKQSLFAAPLAVFIFYWEKERQTAWKFLAALLLSGALLFFILIAFTKGEIYRHLVLYNHNAYRFSDLLYYTRHWVGVYTVWGCAPLLIVVYGLQNIRSKNGSMDPLLLLFAYSVCSIIESSLCGKIGSAPNYLLSLVCATCVGLGWLYREMTRRVHASATWVIAFFFLLNITQIAGTLHFPAGGRMLFKHPLDFAYTPSAVDQQAATLLHNRLKRMDSPILSDRAGVAWTAGHAPVYQPFIFTQLTQQGLWDETRILEQIQQKRFNAIVLVFDVHQPGWDRERFTEAFIHAVRTHYTVEQRYGAYYFYLPISGELK